MGGTECLSDRWAQRPQCLTGARRGLADGVVEVKDRASGEREDVISAVIVDHLVSLVRS